MDRRVITVVALVALALPAGCSGGDPESLPPGTVGALPTPPTPPTLLPVVTGTDVVDTGTVPPDTLFGGNPCSALSEAELRGAAALVPPAATDPTVPDDELGAGVTAAVTVDPADDGPVTTVAVSGDACAFQVTEPVRYTALVRVIGVFDYETPDLEMLSGIGVEAKGGAVGEEDGDRYVVLVKVDDGWFSLEAPDRATATRLARAAAGRCCD